MSGKLKKLTTSKQIRSVFIESGCNFAKAAKLMSEKIDAEVSPQVMRYWVSNLDTKESEAADFNKSEQQKLNAMTENNRMRRIVREVTKNERTIDDVLAGIKAATSNIKPLPEVKLRDPNPHGKPMTVELLFSDLQIGKLMDDYNSKVAVRRIIEYSEVAIAKIRQHIESGYNVERIVFAMIGDIIESDKKHDNSARATDTGTATQMENAVRFISMLVIKPLAELGIKMDVICITGNHDHDGHGLSMFRSGREHLSWPLFHALKMIHNAYGHSHINWVIPEGVFHVDDIYGYKVLYEHGVGVSASEASMKKRLFERSGQTKQYITMFRMGDKHNICRFNNDSMVVNGAFFGDDRTGTEYSGICGYDGYPAQLMFMHVPRKSDRRLPIYDSLAIQLGHIV